MPQSPIRILMLEDTPSDVELALRELRRSGLEFAFEHVETLDAFQAALDNFHPDVILADYNLAGFDGVDALRLSRTRPSPPPFIFVSGSIGEERAVEAVREGATDYVMKDRLARLPMAVVRAIETKERMALEHEAQQALQASEERFRLAARATSDGVWDWDIVEDQVWLSEPYRSIFGYADLPELVPGQWWAERIHPDDAGRMMEVAAYLRQSRQSQWTGVYRFLRADGVWAEIEDHCYVVRDSEGEAVRLIGAVRDITAKRASARALEESEKRYRSVAQTAKDAILILDENARITSSNKGAEQIFGEHVVSTAGQSVSALLALGLGHMGEEDVVALLRDQSGRSGGSSLLPVLARRGDGKTFPVEISVSEWELDGRSFFTVVARDVSDRQRQQMRQQIIARISRDMLNIPVEQFAAQISVALQSAGMFLGCNSACALFFSEDRQRIEEVFEWAPAGLAPLAEDVASLPVAWFSELIRRLRRSPSAVLHHEELTADSPERGLLERVGARSSMCVAVERDRQMIGVIGVSAAHAGLFWDDEDAATLRIIGEVISSVLARKHAVDELARSENMLAEAQTIAALGSWQRNNLTGEILWSDEMARIHGFEPGFKPSREAILQLVHPEDRERIANITDSAEPLNFEYRIVRPDGKTRILQARRTVVLDDSGHILRYQGTVQDMTERVTLERQIDQANRVAHLGRMAATMAHEFNNVLMGIQPFAEILRRRLPPDDTRAEAAVASILNSVNRGRRITQDILRFTHPGTATFTAIDINAWLTALGTELQTVVGDHITVAVECSLVPLSVRGDVQLLAQAFSNLVFNARDSMAKGGTVTISIHPPSGNGTRPFGIVKDPSGSAHVVVADQGEGIPRHVLPNIFDPLFTTKKKGTGIGLAVVHQILQAHGGQIFVESKPGEGTQFHLFLPVEAGRSLPQST